MVRQTLEDCLTEAMDVDGFLEVLGKLRDGSIRKVAVDTPEPSAFARGILNAMPYAFLDDAPLEERRTRAVATRHALDPEIADTLGALDPEAVERVRQEVWPQAEDVEEVHEALLWMGYVTERESAESGWTDWLSELVAGSRVERDGDRWFAVEALREPKAVLRGRLEVLGPVRVAAAESISGGDDERMLHELEADGVVLRCRVGGAVAWCNRRLLARIQRHTLDRLRREIEPVTAADFWRFLAAWQHAAEGYRLDGPRGVAEVVRKLSGFEIPAAEWEASVLPARVHGYKPEWLDHVTLSGEVAWRRLWGAGSSAIRSTPICLVPRLELQTWLALAERSAERLEGTELSSHGRAVLSALESRGPSFTQDLQSASGLLASHFEMGLVELIGHGRISCDSFGGLRRLITPPSRRRGVMKRAPLTPAGRWWGRHSDAGPGDSETTPEAEIELVGRRLLDRYGVVFRKILTRERLPVPWRDLIRLYRHQELRGDVRGGRFVQRFSGEQYALPEAVELMRRLRRSGQEIRATVSAADPLNLRGILTPEERLPSQTRQRVEVG